MEENEREKYRGNKRIRNQWGLKESVRRKGGEKGKGDDIMFFKNRKEKEKSFSNRTMGGIQNLKLMERTK